MTDAVPNIVFFLDTNVRPFLLVMARVSGIFVFAPIFSMAEIPFQLRGYIATFLALVLYPTVAMHLPEIGEGTARYIILLADEVSIGLLIGLFITLFHAAFLLAGQFYSLQMGFALVRVIDPMSQAQIPVLGQLKGLFGMILFITIGGHRLLLAALQHSFEVVPFMALSDTGILAGTMVRSVTEMFEIGFRIAAPLIGTIFLVELIMGILAKTAPQMNVMVVGFQVKILIGLIGVALVMPLVYQMGERIYDHAFTVVYTMMEGMG